MAQQAPEAIHARDHKDGLPSADESSGQLVVPDIRDEAVTPTEEHMLFGRVEHDADCGVKSLVVV